MNTEPLTSRRRFLCLTGSLVAGIALPAIPPAVLAAAKKESEVNTVEDLMREHGVLRRLLLIYEELITRIEASSRLTGPKDPPFGLISESAGIVRSFVENYHEKLEEDEIFPRFEKAGKLTDLVKVLNIQHQAGRRLTDSILKSTEPEAVNTAKAQEESSAAMREIYESRPLFQRGSSDEKPGKSGKPGKLGIASAMRQFIHMYRPHAAREDTVLFPAFRSIVSPREFDELGEKFEDKEKELFGRDGFGKMVESVGDIEKKLGIYELSNFTPKE